MRLRNLKHTSDMDHPAGYASWLDYWEKKSGTKAQRCSSCGSSCILTRLVGAHVQKVGDVDRAWYIVPLCDACNLGKDELYIPDDVALVPVNLSR